MTIPELRVIVGRQVGLPATFDGTSAAYGNLSPAQQVLLNGQMLAFIKQNPGSFTAQQVSVATDEAGHINAVLDDASFNWGLFGDELAVNLENAGSKVASVGTGALDTVNWVGKLLPFVLIAAALYFVYKFTLAKTAAL